MSDKRAKNTESSAPGMPLNKFIAQAGISSRRKAVDLIKEGHVKVNGKVVREPGFRVSRDDAVKVKNKLIKAESLCYVMLNKPRGYITSLKDERGRPTVGQLVNIRERVYPVGRLDFNTTGLLLMTNDGELAQKLAHPRFQAPKVYDVTVHKPVIEKDIEWMLKGVRLKDGVVMVDSCFVLPKAKGSKVRLTTHSGKNRVVRRLFEHLGYIVEKLDRVSFVGLSKKGLAPGTWRFLTAQEIRRLKKL